MADQPLHMWEYWSAKCGIEYALKTYYPETIKKTPTLQYAINSIENAEISINSIMDRLLLEEEARQEEEERKKL